MDPQELKNQQEWEQPENWTGWFGAYRSVHDNRVWVPKRDPAYGWTLNFAHRDAWWSLLGLLIVPIALLVLLPLLLLFR